MGDFTLGPVQTRELPLAGSSDIESEAVVSSDQSEVYHLALGAVHGLRLF